MVWDLFKLQQQSSSKLLFLCLLQLVWTSLSPVTSSSIVDRLNVRQHRMSRSSSSNTNSNNNHYNHNNNHHYSAGHRVPRLPPSALRMPLSPSSSYSSSPSFSKHSSVSPDFIYPQQPSCEQLQAAWRLSLSELSDYMEKSFSNEIPKLVDNPYYLSFLMWKQEQKQEKHSRPLSPVFGHLLRNPISTGHGTSRDNHFNNGFHLSDYSPSDLLVDSGPGGGGGDLDTVEILEDDQSPGILPSDGVFGKIIYSPEERTKMDNHQSESHNNSPQQQQQHQHHQQQQQQHSVPHLGKILTDSSEDGLTPKSDKQTGSRSLLSGSESSGGGSGSGGTKSGRGSSQLSPDEFFGGSWHNGPLGSNA